MKATNKSLGLAIAIGAGIGLVLGPAIFNNAVVGLCLGAGVGVVFGSNRNKTPQK